MFATAVLETRLVTQQRVTTTAYCFAHPSRRHVNMGMIGFDIACVTVRSGSRMQGYLVNDLCKTISANSNRTVSRSAFALAA